MRNPATQPQESSAPRRILLIAATFPPTRCGVADYSRRLGLSLAEAGATVHVLTGAAEDPAHQHGDPDDMGHVGDAPDLREIALPSAEARDDALRVHRTVESWDWGCLDHVEAALREIRPHVMSLQYHGEDFLLHPAVCGLAEMAQRHGVPTVTTFHNLQKPRGWAHGVAPLQLLLESSRRWITTNELDRREMEPLANADDRLRMISTGPCILSDAQRVPRQNGDEFHLAYFGFLNPFKGIEYLLRAVARLRDDGLPLRLTLAAGIHTDATSRLRDYARFIDDEIARLDLDSCSKRPGFLPEEEVSRLLLACDLAVFPFREGVSGKNVSFWSTLHHGTPTLTTKGEGLPPGLADGEHVLLAPCADDAALADRIRWAMGHRESLAEIGEAGRRFVQDRFDWTQLAAQTQAVFEECGLGKESS